MCLAIAYVDRDDRREEVMRDVAWIEPAGGALLLVNFLGEEKLLPARLKSIDFLHSAIVLEREGEDRGDASERSISPP